MRPIHRAAICCLCLVLLLSGCGYTFRGQENSRATHSVFGTGTSTLKITEIDQPTLYPWLPYLLQTLMRDEINARGLAIWKDSGQTDYGLGVKVHEFQFDSYGQSRSQNLLYEAKIITEYIVYDGRTNEVIWSSGRMRYSESYKNVNEETAIQELLENAIRLALDRMQRKF